MKGPKFMILRIMAVSLIGLSKKTVWNTKYPGPYRMKL